MEKKTTDTTKLAGKHYDVKDYEKKDELSSGPAITHEQVSDNYFEGTIDGVMENVAGKNLPLERTGYDETER